MKVIETRPREKGFVLLGHCQNLLDGPRSTIKFCTYRLCANASLINRARGSTALYKPSSALKLCVSRDNPFF